MIFVAEAFAGLNERSRAARDIKNFRFAASQLSSLTRNGMPSDVARLKHMHEEIAVASHLRIVLNPFASLLSHEAAAFNCTIDASM
jgi:hypothetical protein